MHGQNSDQIVKNQKLIIVNRSNNNLFLELKFIKTKQLINRTVKRRCRLQLEKGRYLLKLCYEDMNLLLEHKKGELICLEDNHSFKNNKFKGKELIFKSPSTKIKLVCREKISIASIVESLY